MMAGYLGFPHGVCGSKYLYHFVIVCDKSAYIRDGKKTFFPNLI